MKNKFKYIYGPVHSWRLGVSLGIDPISQSEKICNLDCVYCQLGKGERRENERKIYVPTDDVVREVNEFPAKNIDHLTFSGRGEPTLARNLGDMIRAIRSCRSEKIAVITNSLLLSRPDVRQDLATADFVVAKIDACDQATLTCVNRPWQAIHFEAIIDGLKTFRQGFHGRLAIQIMFIEANQSTAGRMADIVRQIPADEIEINTPLRPSAVQPLSESQLQEMKKYFQGLPARTVYEAQRLSYQPYDVTDTVRRHGNYHSL